MTRRRKERASMRITRSAAQQIEIHIGNHRAERGAMLGEDSEGTICRVEVAVSYTHLVGATHRVPIKARIVAATNRDLAEMVEKGSFRKDLFYRLNVVNLRLPSLRDRREDIPLLAAHFLDHISREHGAKFTLSDEALRTMMLHDWPGNVRELENSIERACALSSGPILHLGDLPTQLQQQGLEARRSTALAGEPEAEGGSPQLTTLADLERQAILGAIRALNGDKLQAAKLLGIGKTTLYRKLKEYGIADPLREE